MGDMARKSFDKADEIRPIEDGQVDVVQLAGSSAARATFEPGWKWSTSIKPLIGGDSCQNHHVGYCLSGALHIVSDSGDEIDIGPDDVYEILPGHDAWV